MEPRYQHNDDTRTPNEILLTNILVERISDINLKVIQKNKFDCLHRNKKIVTIGINGLPYDPKEFQDFIFPGVFINYFAPGLEPQGNDEFYRARLKNLNAKFIVDEIDDIVDRQGGKVILIYHSFGTHVATIYTHYRPEKIVGIIELGTNPITNYKNLKHFHQYSLGRNLDNLESIDFDQYYNSYRKSMGNSKSPRPIENKYNFVAGQILVSRFAEDIFEWRRNLPKVLKMIAFGSKDRVIPPDLIKQMAVYYTYGQKGRPKLDIQYEKRLILIYKQLTGLQTQNIQERFIFQFKNGIHGLHKTLKKELQQLMNLYFALILRDIPQRPKF